MLYYCLKCKKNTENIIRKVFKTNNGKTMMLSVCTVCGSKKLKFIKKQEASGILSSVGIRTPLNKISVLGGFECNSSENYKMNDLINTFLLPGDISMPEMHLKQPGFTYSACGPFTKNKERIQKFK